MRTPIRTPIPHYKHENVANADSESRFNYELRVLFTSHRYYWNYEQQKKQLLNLDTKQANYEKRQDYYYFPYWH